MSDIPVLSNAASAEQVNAALQEFGAVILEEFIGPAILDAFNVEVDSLLAAAHSEEQGFVSEAVAQFFGDRVTHLSGLAGKVPLFNQHILCHPRYMDVCEHFLKPNCSDYQLNIAHLMERRPGSEAQFIHRDAWVWKRMPVTAGEIQVASLVALSDFTAENGGTLIVPGSHLWDDQRYPQPGEEIATRMSAGSAVIYLGNTFHGGGGNTTANEVRRGLHVSYTLGWLRTEENQCLATPLEVARKLPLRSQQLLGFGVHDDIDAGGGYLGTVELEPAHARMARHKL